MNEGWFWVRSGRCPSGGVWVGRTLWVWDQFLGGGKCGRNSDSGPGWEQDGVGEDGWRK